MGDLLIDLLIGLVYGKYFLEFFVTLIKDNEQFCLKLLNINIQRVMG